MAHSKGRIEEGQLGEREEDMAHSKVRIEGQLGQRETVAIYLTVVTDQNLRKTLTKYRLSEHSLAIEKGRHRKTWLPVEERLCNYCTTAEPETELHFLTRCKKI